MSEQTKLAGSGAKMSELAEKQILDMSVWLLASAWSLIITVAIFGDSIR